MHTTKVLLTIDVESFANGNPHKNIIGKIDNSEIEYGVPLILKILEANNAKAVFYLNVYESSKFGEEVIKKVANLIVDYNQDLQLHTHPGTMFGNESMASLSLEEQEKIINIGKDLIFKWTGKLVKSHRAGSFLGDSNTLKALNKNNLLIDSSLSPVFNSPLYREGYSFNEPVLINEVIELPITFYRQFNIFKNKFRRFLDVESCSLAELKTILNKFTDEQYSVINIIMHSFSFTRYGKADLKMINKFENLLKYINDHQKLIFANTSDVIDMAKDIKTKELLVEKDIPYTGFILTYARALSRIKIGWKNFIFVSTIPITIFLIYLIISMF